jgi:predicted nucleic acid-binding protein
LFRENQKFLTEGVMLELSILIKNTQGSPLAAKYLENLLKTCELIKTNDNDLEAALDILKKYNFNDNYRKQFSLCDALQLALAERLGIHLYSLDEAMSLYKPKNSQCQVKTLCTAN